MWLEYPGAGKELKFHSTDIAGELWIVFPVFRIVLTFTCDFSVVSKLYVNWLNNENLEFGGRLVDGLGNA